eukprot:CAMPEP_0117446686 /NCGR_PEP_ID=MMETSP0759-20121206/6477_1 /TAXON_ID=63605 /ORGANISM="Percolomonas cosmopolitus, Strain WS" /LENGTH=532 /DNA_ID=CAMNT_0005238977 /DNA_START=7 /DNA_END=1605 /DNA_ORIENTATION=+
MTSLHSRFLAPVIFLVLLIHTIHSQQQQIYILSHNSFSHSVIPHRLKRFLQQKFSTHDPQVNVEHFQLKRLSEDSLAELPLKSGSVAPPPLYLVETFLLFGSAFSKNLYSLLNSTNVVLLSIGLPSDSIWLPLLARNETQWGMYPKEASEMKELFRVQPSSLRSNFLSQVHKEILPFKELIANFVFEMMRSFFQLRHGKLDVVYFDAKLGGKEVNKLNSKQRFFRLSPLVQYSIDESNALQQKGDLTPAEQNIISWMKSETNRHRNRVVYVSFRSRSNLDTERLTFLVKTFESFLSSKDEFLVLLQLNTPDQQSRDAQMLSGRLYIRNGLIDHSWLLRMSQIELWVHQGGFNSMMESIFWRKPSIIIPMNIDQFENAIRISTLQIGMNINTKASNKHIAVQFMTALNAYFDEQSEHLLSLYRYNVEQLAHQMERSQIDEEGFADYISNRLKSVIAEHSIPGHYTHPVQFNDVVIVVGIAVFLAIMWGYGCHQLNSCLRATGVPKKRDGKKKFLQQKKIALVAEKRAKLAERR